MGKLLDKERTKKYIANGGNHCPFCEGYPISAGETDFDGTIMWQSITCLNCGKEWNDIYELTSVEEEE